MLKNKFTFIFIIILLILLQPTVIKAAGRPEYPNKHPLQPKPIDAYPNVSGNINSTVENSLPMIDTEVESSPQNEIIDSTVAPHNTEKPQSYMWWYILSSILLIISFVIYFRKRKVN